MGTGEGGELLGLDVVGGVLWVLSGLRNEFGAGLVVLCLKNPRGKRMSEAYGVFGCSALLEHGLHVAAASCRTTQ